VRRPTRFAGAALVVALLTTGCAHRTGSKQRFVTPPPALPSTSTPPAVATAFGHPYGTTDCTPARPHASGQSSVDIRSGGHDRNYLLYVPPTYDGRRAAPMVFNFHGYGSSALQQALYTNFQSLSDRDGVILVAPNGQGKPSHFNLLTPPAGEGDDVVFTVDILNQLERQLCVDKQRVYSTGMSNGGGMSLSLACRQSDRFAAFGPVAVLVYAPECDRARPVPIAGFAGTADPVVPFNGGRVSCCGNPELGSEPAAMAAWASHDGCAATPVEQPVSPTVTLRRWSNCRAGTSVDFYIVQGGGHTWPGATFNVGLGGTTDDISATNTIWTFFQAHPLPA
jgi:polyhydroxybutyrate depolymerase